jgi:hypothetical protein
MKEINCDNGVRLGYIIWENDRFEFKPIDGFGYTEYMLEQALKRIRECRLR